MESNHKNKYNDNNNKFFYYTYCCNWSLISLEKGKEQMIGIKLTSTKLRLSYWLNKKVSKRIMSLLCGQYHLVLCIIWCHPYQPEVDNTHLVIPQDCLVTQWQTWTRSQVKFAASQPHLSHYATLPHHQQCKHPLWTYSPSHPNPQQGLEGKGGQTANSVLALYANSYPCPVR